MSAKRKADACILCGVCNNDNPSFWLTKDEKRSTRHAVWLVKGGRDGPWLYGVLLNGVAEKNCPLLITIDEEIIAARRRTVTAGVETRANKELIEKLKSGKNLF